MGSRRFRIEFAPTAWNEVGALSSDEFRTLQRALSELADDVARSKNTVALAPRAGLQLGPLDANYAVDPVSETLTLLWVRKSSGSKGS